MIVAASRPMRRSANSWMVSSISGRRLAKGSQAILAFPSGESSPLLRKATGERGAS